MALLDAIIGPISQLLDRIIPDPRARDAAKLQLLKLQGDQEMQSLATQMQAIVAEAQSPDPWTSRARPSFLYIKGIQDPDDARLAVNSGADALIVSNPCESRTSSGY